MKNRKKYGLDYLREQKGYLLYQDKSGYRLRIPLELDLERFIPA